MMISRWLLGAIVVALCWTAGIASAQPATPSIEALVSRLASATDPYAVAEARAAIVTQLRDPSADATTVTTRNNQVAAALPAALAADKPEVVRLNAVLVASAMSDPKALDLLAKAAQDKHEAVRLRAVKGIGMIFKRAREEQRADQPQWKQAAGRTLEILTKLQEVEASSRVLADSFEAMTQLLDVEPKALPTLLDALSKRPGIRLASPHARMRAEHDALRQVSRMLISDPSAPQDHIKKLASVSLLYLDVSATILQRDGSADAESKLAPGSIREYEDMIRDADVISTWATSKLAPDAPAAPPLAVPLNLTDVKLRVQRLRLILEKPPVSIASDELTVQASPRVGERLE